MPNPPAQVVLLQLFQKKWEEHYNRNWRPMSYQYKQAWDAVTVPEGFEPYTLDDFSERIAIYFSRKDDWIVGCRHNFSVFCKHFEKWVPEARPKVQRVKRYCSLCFSEHYPDEPHKQVKVADPAQVKNLLSEVTKKMEVK